MAMSVPPPQPNRNGRNYSIILGLDNYISDTDNSKRGSGSIYMPYISNTERVDFSLGPKGSKGPQGTTLNFTSVACTDCGNDNLGTLTLSPDNKLRCIRCHDKFMMVHDIPKCGGCGEPTPFGHKFESVIHCDVCYHILLANKVKSQVSELTVDDHEPTWEVPPTSYDTEGGIRGKRTQKQQLEPKDIGEMHMTPDRMKVLQELQEGIRMHKKAPKEHPIKASKARKLVKETKVGRWLSKLMDNIKEGWAEMMEEKIEATPEIKNVKEPQVEEKVEATSEAEKVETTHVETKEETKEEPKTKES